MLAGVEPEDIEEARQMIANSSVDAAQFSDYFGWDLPRAEQIEAALRAQVQAA